MSDLTYIQSLYGHSYKFSKKDVSWVVDIYPTYVYDLYHVS